jgi:hypothetical protein
VLNDSLNNQYFALIFFPPSHRFIAFTLLYNFIDFIVTDVDDFDMMH